MVSCSSKKLEGILGVSLHSDRLILKGRPERRKSVSLPVGGVGIMRLARLVCLGVSV